MCYEKSKQGLNLPSISHNVGQNILVMSVTQKLNFGFWRLRGNQIRESVSVVLITGWKYKVCTFQTGIGILQLYCTGYH